MLKAIRRIGASKLATVSECQQPQGTLVALKEYDRQVMGEFRHERIFTAAERWKSLTHPGLIRYLSVEPAANRVVMELLDRSAAIRLTEGHSDPRLVLHTLRGVLASLAYVHEQGLLHVNLKPTNVFFDTDGRARLSDGLLMPLQAPGTLPPPTNQKYLTPEHTSDAYGPMSPATDLYAAGFLALELLAGDRFGRSFQGIGDNAADDDLAWFQWHGSSLEAPPATSFAKTCPTELTAVIARLLAKQPAARYTSARDALNDLPQDITSPMHPGVIAAKPVAETNREALSSHVIDRPSTGIVIAIASGPRAGEMLGTNETELLIGFDHDCYLRFTADQYPNGGSKVLLRRGPQGWYALRVSGDGAFVNQQALDEKSVLRSGDIVRLSSRGPDVQFTMQTGGVAVRTLVSRFLPSQSSKNPALTPPRAPLAQAGSVLAAGNHAAPGGAGAQTKHAPAAPMRPSSAAPTRPAASANVATMHGSPPATAAGAGRPLAGEARMLAGPKAPSASNEPAGRKRNAAPSSPRGSTSNRTKQAGTNSSGGSQSFSWLVPKTWNKNQTNTVIAIVGGICVLIAVLLFPTGSKPNKSSDSDGSKEQSGSPSSTLEPTTEEGEQASEPITAPVLGDQQASDDQ